MPSVAWPSIAMMRSPGSMPARAAGVPSIGAITSGTPMLSEMRMPMPPNRPSIACAVSRYSRSVM